MDKDQAIQIIIYECQELDGFLVKLRAKREFDSDRFKKLVDAIQIYRDGIVGEDCINRRIAGCLFYLVTIVENMSQHFEHHNLPDKEKVTEAHSEIWNLVESLYDVFT